MTQSFRFDFLLVSDVDPFSASNARFISVRLLFPKGAINHRGSFLAKDEVNGTLGSSCSCLLCGFGDLVVSPHPLPRNSVVLDNTLQSTLDGVHGRKPAAPVRARLEMAVAQRLSQVSCFLQRICPGVFRVEE